MLDDRRFEVIQHDVTFPIYGEMQQVYNLACPAPPVHYQTDPVQTTKTSVHGAINPLPRSVRCRRRRTTRSSGNPTSRSHARHSTGNPA